MADRVAALAATSPIQSGPTNTSSGLYVNSGQGPKQSNATSNKASPYLVVDLA